MRTEDTPRLRLSALPRSAPLPIRWEPDAAGRESLAAAAGARTIRKLRLAGELRPEGRSDWRLVAELGATAVQDCAVTLEPVTTRIDAPLERLYAADLPDDPPGETEMAEDGDLVEPLPDWLDLSAVVAEVLALELPEFPRAEGVAAGPIRAVPPGAAPLDDEREKPFAGLASLRDRMRGED